MLSLMLGLFARKKEVFFIDKEGFMEKYNKGFFIVPDYAIRGMSNPNLRTTFHKSEENCEHIEKGSTLIQSLGSMMFYASKDKQRLKNLKGEN